jgi:hypothetical protein
MNAPFSRSSLVASALAGLMGYSAAGQPGADLVRCLDRAEYRERLRGMWLGECIANWTGLTTEGARAEPPFYTDTDWGLAFDGRQPRFVTWLDPWWADDDTDIEYVWQHLLVGLHEPPAGPAPLTPAQIAAGWTAHVNRFIWVSNAAARGLIGRGVRPPATSLGAANPWRLHIDAQLTTEVFGALCPGMPEEALRQADLAIRTTAAGYAVHAAQFHVALYSLAAVSDPSMPARDRVVQMVQRARRFIPDSSKSADAVDFVLADFLANPDPDDWESTRDRIYARYQLNAVANGFQYRGWFESTVNLACGVMALLYGQGDFRRTVQIGTLSGWDSDNGTATMGGLLGLMNGAEWVREQFPGTPLSDRFWILRTRDNLPDYLPDDPEAEDTYDRMAARLVPLVEGVIAGAGGRVAGGGGAGGRWLLPPVAPGAPAAEGGMLVYNPAWWEDRRSANVRVRRSGGLAVGAASPVGAPGPGRGTGWAQIVALGQPQNFAGLEPDDNLETFFSSEGAGWPPGAEHVIQVTWDRPVEAAVVRFVEGDHFDGAGGMPQGGWFTAIGVEVQTGGPLGAWAPVAGGWSDVLDPGRPFQVLDLVLESPIMVTGVRVRGPAGGTGAFVTCVALDVLSSTPTPAQRPAGTFEVDGSPGVGVDDLVAWSESPVDLDGDGVAGASDARYLEAALRWGEAADMAAGRR